jgi:hypothetical protein
MNIITKLYRLLSVTLTIAASVTFNASPVWSQVSTSYTFSSTAGTYTAITGGTVIGTATATTGAAALDDVVIDLPAGTIPFSFNFDNVNYTGCKVSTNGFITFGAVAPAASGSATGFTPLSAVTAYSGAVSAFGRNLAGYFFAGNAAQTAELRYQTLGSAPNRIFVIQYKNFKPFNYSTTAFTSPMNMQIRLKETSNAIEVVYNISGTFGSSILAQVGLRGASNGFPTNINNRSVATGVNTWPASTAGTSNTATCEILNTLIPASGLTYTWAPQTCPAPTTQGVTNVTANSAQLTWVSGGGSGTYKVEWGPQGFTPGSGTVINNAVSPQSIAGLTGATNYAFYVQQMCGASGNSANAGPFNFISGTAGEDCSTAPTVSVALSLAACNFTTVSSGVSQNGPNGNCSDATGNLANDDRWYKFVAPSTGKKLVITTTAGTVNDWVMQLWSSCGLNPNDLVKCGDDENGFMPEITLCQNEYVAGQTYYIRAWTYSQSLTGTMNLCVYQDVPCIVAPANDECINATRLTVNNSTGCPAGTVSFTDLSATPSGDAATCDASTKNDVWFVFNTGNLGDIRATFTKGTATTLKAQLLFECGGQEIACWNPADGTPKILSGLNPVADYILRVWSDAGTAGTFSVCLNDVCANPTATLSGNTTICPGNTANLVVDFTGTPPFTFTYFNGSVNAMISGININPYILQALPASTTTYSLVSMSDATCSGTTSGTATVNIIVAPTVTLAAFSPICTNAGMQNLTGGSPAGGVYSGLGVTGSTFDPSVGTSTITYTVTYGTGCQKSASRVWTVSTAPVVTLNGFAAVCSTAPSFALSGGTPGGGTYSGPGVSGNTFNPATAGLGVKVITYTVSSGGCQGVDTATITVNNCAGCANPPTANAGADKSSCGSAAVVLSGASIGGAASTLTWSTAGTGTFSPNATTLAASYNPSVADITAGSVKIYLTTNDPDGAGACVAAKDSLIITFLSAPGTGTISGFSNFCRNTSGNIYSVPAQSGVQFTWTVPTGASISSGQGTNSISVAFSNTAVSGNICVTGSNVCGSGTQVCKAITLRTAAPGTPGTVTGSTIGCPGDSKVYSIVAIAAANQYLWTPPVGAKINGSSAPLLTTNTTVTVNYDTGFGGDTLRVSALNCFGQSAERKLRINKTAPGTPGTITGQAAGLCNLSNVAYSIAAVTNAASYSWRTTVAGATINGSASPVTTSSLSVTVNFGTFTTGSIFVKANSGCGSSAERSLALAGRPAIPVAITGPLTVCKSQSGVAYSIAAVPFATSYGWTVPTGASIASGGTTTNITVNYGASAVSGTVKARSTNACGSSSYLSVNVTVNTCPKIGDNTSVPDALYMEAYPNPVHGWLHVTLLSPQSGAYDMIITDLTGRIVQSQTVSATAGENSFQINTGALATGAYMVSLRSAAGTVQQRIIIE